MEQAQLVQELKDKLAQGEIVAFAYTKKTDGKRRFAIGTHNQGIVNAMKKAHMISGMELLLQKAHADTLDQLSDSEREEYVKELNDHIVRAQSKGEGKRKEAPPTLITYWDMGSGAFRSLDVDQLTEVFS